MGREWLDPGDNKPTPTWMKVCFYLVCIGLWIWFVFTQVEFK